LRTPGRRRPPLLGFDTFVFWPESDPLAQVERFAREVVPGVREAVAKARTE
jgi:hypothetical protein